jgi:hypothetical protein
VLFVDPQSSRRNKKRGNSLQGELKIPNPKLSVNEKKEEKKEDF